MLRACLILTFLFTIVASDERLELSVATLARQLQLQQLFVEERIRSDGDSGLKQTRVNIAGTKPYHVPSHTRNSVASIHDHSNNIRTVGMGEFVAVLNGVEFRTRHNDYRLRMPSRRERTYGKLDEIPFPEVPQEVLNKGTVDEQIAELREYFKAWKNGDVKHRNYRPHFKPVLCYLEGAWTTNTKTLDEPFFSDRHFIDAESWFDLQQKIFFTSYTGSKSNLENFSYLPTTVMELVNNTLPKLAQWNYRIACHPLKKYVELNAFQVVDDLGARMAQQRKLEDFAKTRAARFRLSPDGKAWTERERSLRFEFIDELMREIPGKDNYPSNVTDNAFGLKTSDILTETQLNEKNLKPFNAGYYHRWYKVNAKGAMGLSVRSRGFSDANLYVALNTRPEIAGARVKQCVGKRKKRCEYMTQRVSYAIPLEIVYLTPLSSWNPYKLPYRGEANTDEGRTVTADGRTGGLSADEAYDGTNSKLYYLTPDSFFQGGINEKDPADTSQGVVGVLDKDGAVKKVRAAGIRVFFPKINEVGVLRQRYPIMPIHAEGNVMWKELEALKDMVMEQQKYINMFRDLPLAGSYVDKNLNSTAPKPITLETSLSTKIPPGAHTHTIEVSVQELKELKMGRTLTKITSEDNGHSHEMIITYKSSTQQKSNGDTILRERYIADRCDGKWNCWDGHKRHLNIIINDGE